MHKMEMTGQGMTDGDEAALLGRWEQRFVRWLEVNGDHSDGSHDLGHFQRVWKAAKFIRGNEGELGTEGDELGQQSGVELAGQVGGEVGAEGEVAGKAVGGLAGGAASADLLVLLAAAYFHDLVSLPKNHPQRSASSLLSAEKTALLLETDFPDFPREKIAGVRHAIHAHSFSAGVPPLTIEAKILQDADRMEAVGAIGLARVFYTAGQLGQRLFDGKDPMAEQRELNDQLYALDHFRVKLLKLPALMHTKAGRRLAEANADYLRAFLRKIEQEIKGDY